MAGGDAFCPETGGGASFLKRTALDSEVCGNFSPIAGTPFLVKVFKHLVAGLLQMFLEEADSLDPFQAEVWYQIEPSCSDL